MYQSNTTTKICLADYPQTKRHATSTYSHVHKSVGRLRQLSLTLWVCELFGAALLHDIILLGLGENSGYVYGNGEAQEGRPKHISIFEAFVVIVFTSISLAKANRMAHPNISRTEKYTLPLATGTTESPGKGWRSREG